MLESAHKESVVPLTPYHLGASSWLGLGLTRVFDFATLLVASVIVDVEPFVVLVLDLDYPTHGFLHTFLGGSVLAIVTAIGMYVVRGWSKRALAVFKLAQESSFRKILWTAFFGVQFHVILDSFTHCTMKPLYPYAGNPFLGVFTAMQIELFCVIGFILAVLLYASLVILAARRRREG